MPFRPLASGVRCLFVSLLVWLAGTASAATHVSFSKEIQPILESACWKCHGAAVQLSRLDLRTRESALKGGEHGSVLTPGNAETSRLFRMIAGLEKPAMPLDRKLAGEQIETIKRWIEQGLVWDATSVPGPAGGNAASDLESAVIPPEARKYWAFQKPVRSAIPVTGSERMNRHPVDAFLMRSMEKDGLKPAPVADRVTLLRRAYFDLIGMPPSPSEAAQFLDDKAPNAWERLVDRLLDSPQYGERWGRHWLDVARYADSNGYEHDFNRPNAWRYRDYVIQSFNKDTPFNVFLREQIAGDELDWVTKDSLIATGFLRNYAKVGYREKDNPEYRYDYLDDMIATVGRGILGLTVQCARCHNHKFDPIPQKDYYRMQASLFGYVEVDHPLTTREEAERFQKKMDAVELRLKELRAEVRRLEQPYRDILLPDKYKKYPANVQAAIATSEPERTPGQVLLANQVVRNTSVSTAEIERIMKPVDLEQKKRLTAEISAAEKERPEPIPVAMGITDGDYRFTPDGAGDEPAPGKGVKKEAIEGSFLHSGAGKYQAPPAHFLIRGDIHSRGSVMQPGFLSVTATEDSRTELPPAHGHTSGRRRALAEWLVSEDHPLTARVIVNRIWHHHFGRGIVATLDNFGKMGDLPTHPELLDWLALEFMDRGWSFKQMHRMLMTSEAYKLSSEFADPGNLARDPENKQLWRFRMRRLDAESVRDSILAASGALNREMGGPAVFPKLPGEVLSSMKNGIWQKEEDGPKVWRRSVYIYRKRGLPFPMLESFDLPDQNIACGARGISTVPTQALALLNDTFVLRQTDLLAGRAKEMTGDDRDAQASMVYRITLSREPNAEERKLALAFLESHSLAGLAHVLLNLNEFLYIR